MRRHLLRWGCGGVLAVLASSGVAHAHENEARRLSLRDAIDAAWAADPVVTQARIARERAELTVLRSQLDRVSVRVDGSLQELFNKSNIGGPRIELCMFGAIQLALPAADCTAMGGTSSVAPNSSPNTVQGLFNLQAQVQVPIFSGFRVESTVKRNQLLASSASLGERQARREIALATARAYWSVRRLALLVEAQKDAVARLEHSEQATDARVKAGLAPGLDRNRARSRKLQQLSTMIDLKGQQREAEVQLAVSLQIDGEIELTDTIDLSEPAGCTQHNLDLKPSHGRPELLRAKLQVDVQSQMIRIAKSSYYPQLTGFFLFQYGNNALSVGSGARSITSAANPFSNLAGNLTAGGQLTINLFDMLNTYTAVKDARFEEARLFGEVKRTERAIDSEVRMACARVDRLVARRTAQVDARELARDNLVSLEQRYKNGDALMIELLDGQLELTNAELQLVDLAAQLQLARLELIAAQSGSPLRGETQ